MKILNEDNVLIPNTEGLTEEEIQMLKKKKLITEYVETGEGRGVSVRPLNEKVLKNIDGKEILMETEEVK